MKAAKVDQDLCIGCGLCCGICDKVFRMNEQGTAKRINRQQTKIKMPYKRLSTRVLYLQSSGTIDLNVFICFSD